MSAYNVILSGFEDIKCTSMYKKKNCKIFTYPAISLNEEGQNLQH